jgi:hypothetical protein
VPDECEIAAVVLAPHFDAVRDTFACYEPEPGLRLDRLLKTRLIVRKSIHNSPRHYAACRDDGAEILCAPQIVDDVPVPQLVAILAHEFGHASDMAYPGQWVVLRPGSRDQKAIFIGEPDDRRAVYWRERLWHERSRDEIEWTADAIAELVTGRLIHYCGDCVLQCFAPLPGAGLRYGRRPAGLR